MTSACEGDTMMENDLSLLRQGATLLAGSSGIAIHRVSGRVNDRLNLNRYLRSTSAAFVTTAPPSDEATPLAASQTFAKPCSASGRAACIIDASYVLTIAAQKYCHCPTNAPHPCVPGTLTFDRARTPSGSFVEECEPVMAMSAAAACSSFWGKR